MQVNKIPNGQDKQAQEKNSSDGALRGGGPGAEACNGHRDSEWGNLGLGSSIIGGSTPSKSFGGVAQSGDQPNTYVDVTKSPTLPRPHNRLGKK